MNSPTVEDIQIGQKLSDGLQWRAMDRFGENTSDELLQNGQYAVHEAIQAQGLRFDGWVQKAARSVVALANEGTYVVKVPLVDGVNIANAIQLYSDLGTGPVLQQQYCSSNTMMALTMERVDGLFFHPDEHPELYELREVVHTVLATQPSTDDVLHSFMSLRGRINLEVLEATHRAEQHGILTGVSTLHELAERILAHDEVEVLCHGDVDLRNILHAGGDMRLIDPEPLVAPIAWEVAKISMSTKRSPEQVADFCGVNPELTAEIHDFMQTAGDIYIRNRRADPRAQNIAFTIK